jgi:hypothetical protein
MSYERLESGTSHSRLHHAQGRDKFNLYQGRAVGRGLVHFPFSVSRKGKAMSYALKVLADKPVLGRFDKALEGGRALNFGMSAGANCDSQCRYHPENKKSDAAGRCYAIRSENRFDRVQLLNKLMRHENADPAMLCRKALAELHVIYAGGNSVPWFRFSTNGSVPPPKKCTPAFRKAFLALLDYLDEQNIPVHLPVETRRKYRFYKKLVGPRCVVRLSAGSEKDFLNSTVPVSYVGGVMDMNRKERITASKVVGRKRFDKSGRRAIVCPAVADFFLNGTPHARSKAKCGNCVACADPAVDVIYPLH